MKTFLIAHVQVGTKAGSVAQATIRSSNMGTALRAFDKQFPLRKATVVGVAGDENSGTRIA